MDTNAASIIKKLKQFANLKTDTQLAQILGITRSGLCSWKTRNSVDFVRIVNCFEFISLDWLIYDIGEPIIPRTLSKSPLETLNSTITSERIEHIWEEVNQVKCSMASDEDTIEVKAKLYIQGKDLYKFHDLINQECVTVDKVEFKNYR